LAVLPDFKLRYSQISQKISQNWQRPIAKFEKQRKALNFTERYSLSFPC